MSVGESKVPCSAEQYCIGTWNVRFMNQGKLDMVKQEMTRVSIDILWMSELKCMRMYGFNSDDHYVYYCGQESLRRNGVALMSTKESRTQFSSVQFSYSVMSDSLRPHELQHARPPCPSPTPRVHSNSCPLSRWCHPAIHPLSSPSPPAPNPSQHQGLFQWVNSSNEVAKVLEFQPQHQSFQWTLKTGLL